MRLDPNVLLDISPYRAHISAALRYAGDTHSVDDVAAMIDAGHAQLWPGPSSLIVSEIVVSPRHKTLHFFLAAGRLAEVKALSKIVLDWGRQQGCTRASLVGRKGWSRVLPEWSVSDLILMQRAL